MKKRVISVIVMLVVLITTIPFVALASSEEVIFTITDNLTNSDNLKSYEITLDNPGRIYFDFTNPANTSWMAANGWRIHLFDSNENQFYFYEHNTRTTGFTSRNFFLDSGTYKLTVRNIPMWLTDFSYSITCYYEENIGQFEIEPNDLPNAANKISLNKPITGNLYFNNDVDWFEFIAPYDVRVVLDFSHANLQENSDFWQISLLGTDGSAFTNFSSNGNTHGRRSNEVELKAGTYRVKVQSGRIWRHAPYTLTVSEVLTTADALNILRHVAGIIQLTSEQRAKYGLSDEVTSGHALSVLRSVAGL
ncbi:MAG: hypothetical protein FWD48_00275 [Oscillospiraceae bacterium]|nr:hypothetical protein [Oscillospiraceae bacterium]